MLSIRWIALSTFLNNWGQINHYPVDNAIDFPNAYLLDSDLTAE